MVLGDSRGGERLESPVGCEDEEEKLLKQAIALSLEGTAENANEKDAEEDGEEEEEELMLRKAIGLSLEGAEEDYEDLDLD